MHSKYILNVQILFLLEKIIYTQYFLYILFIILNTALYKYFIFTTLAYLKCKISHKR